MTGVYSQDSLTKKRVPTFSGYSRYQCAVNVFWIYFQVECEVHVFFPDPVIGNVEAV